MKTAIEWLLENAHIIPKGELNKKELIEQAKEMEKQQIIDAYDAGFENATEVSVGSDDEIVEAEEYYNETYGK